MSTMSVSSEKTCTRFQTVVRLTHFYPLVSREFSRRIRIVAPGSLRQFYRFECFWRIIFSEFAEMENFPPFSYLSSLSISTLVLVAFFSVPVSSSSFVDSRSAANLSLNASFVNVRLSKRLVGFPPRASRVLVSRTTLSIARALASRTIFPRRSASKLFLNFFFLSRRSRKRSSRTRASTYNRSLTLTTSSVSFTSSFLIFYS